MCIYLFFIKYYILHINHNVERAGIQKRVSVDSVVYIERVLCAYTPWVEILHKNDAMFWVALLRNNVFASAMETVVGWNLVDPVLIIYLIVVFW